MKKVFRQAQHKVAIFDIDGTIYRSSFLVEIVDALIQEGIFPKRVALDYAKAYKMWIERRGSYEVYINDLLKVFFRNIRGVRKIAFLKIARKVVYFHKNRIYTYTRDLTKELKKKNYYLLAISNSPREVVEVFCKNLGFDKVYGRIYGTDKKGRLTGEGIYFDLMDDKSKVLRRAVEKEALTLKGSVGVGDTDSDIPFLKMVEHPICFNPNERLYQYAKRAGWKIVVERKDVIYFL